ncbi:CPBP family intramembrane glutamic endopeptidase [Rhodococcus opacus]|uniref:CPBP family intramembrane glutamic endopeptidase n=1 Tax=Rhodococcus opacus TaxID=37919 RepID=UPI001F59CB31|nr:type II CAAX endopeptidase family protein [Rhodococcus opacus]UNN05332.1 CPBP family intramembrane metalloprotease [Rhodococcus opacus]
MSDAAIDKQDKPSNGDRHDRVRDKRFLITATGPLLGTLWAALLAPDQPLAAILGALIFFALAALMVKKASPIGPAWNVRAEFARGFRWLGFGLVRIRDRQVAVRAQLMWIVVIPTALALLDYHYLSELISEAFPVVDPAELAAQETRHANVKTLYGALAASFLGASLFEEIVFRGLPLIVQRWRPHATILIAITAAASTALFALVHSDFGTGNVVSAFIGGVVYVALALYTRSLWPSIMAHGIYDAIIMVSWVM